jgi:hypothetical protein
LQLRQFERCLLIYLSNQEINLDEARIKLSGGRSVAAMETDMKLAAIRNTGWIYVTVATLPNAYCTLPSYWIQFVGAVAASPELTVQFGLGVGTSSGRFGPVTNDGDDIFTAKFRGSTAGTPRTITASIDGHAVASRLPTITVTART